MRTFFFPVMVNFLFFLALSLGLLLQSTAQNHMIMTPGGPFLSASGQTYLTSSSGDFAFGFYSINQTHFLLATWFNRTSGTQPIIWFATSDGNPILFTSGDNLLLTQVSLSAGKWSQSAQGAANATLTDEGNFIVYNITNGPTWQSFDYPSDTIVPGQTLNADKPIWSKLNVNDFSKGRFFLRVQLDDGNIVVYSASLPNYNRYPIWASGTYIPDKNCSPTLLVFNSNGSLYYHICYGTGNITAAPTYSSNEYYQHATLDPDGVFRVYVYPKKQTASEWKVVGQTLLNACNISTSGGGLCGFNAYCNFTNASPMYEDCICPPRYSFVDPESKYKGCMPSFATPSCDNYQPDHFKFIPLNNTNWAHQDYDSFILGGSAEDCKDACLNDCACVVAVFEENGCWKKSVPLQLGQSGTYINWTAYIKVPKSNNTIFFFNLIRSKGGFSVLGSMVVAIALLSGAVCFLTWKKARLISNLLVMKPRAFTYAEIYHATRGFREEIGQGAYGTVYRGLLESDPQVEIAVKMLKLTNDGEREFRNEVLSIGQANHKNLVKMLGFCYEGKHRLLVYEYMCKGNLTKFIFGDTRLRWNQLADIAVSIAKGLQYLHEECSFQVIHCDIKPQNILLDNNLVPKIADFGVAKLLQADQSRTNTFARGSLAYMAPEWFLEGSKEPDSLENVEITAKVDVYSFGVLLLEIISGRKNTKEWASECLSAKSCDQLVEGDEEALADIWRVELYIKVALRCTERIPALRPTMHEVVQALAGDITFSVECSTSRSSYSAFSISNHRYQYVSNEKSNEQMPITL